VSSKSNKWRNDVLDGCGDWEQPYKPGNAKHTPKQKQKTGQERAFQKGLLFVEFRNIIHFAGVGAE
jgi:hypothetical protein